MKSLFSPFRNVAKTFAAAPLLLLVAQIPEVSVDWVDRAFRQDFEKHPALGAVALFPYFAVMSALSTALTGIAARELTAGNRVTLSGVWHVVRPRLGSLFKASLLSGVFVLVGMPVLVPAVYFMTVYLLVPLTVVFESPAPAFTILARSKNLVRRRFWPVLGFTLFFLLVGVAMFLVQGEIDKRFLENSEAPRLTGAIIDTVFSLILGVGVNLGIFQIYGWLLGLAANPAPSTSANATLKNT
jgi:hypothetical protein